MPEVWKADRWMVMAILQRFPVGPWNLKKRCYWNFNRKHVFNLTFCSGFARLWPGEVCGTIWDSPAYVRPLGYQDEPNSGKDHTSRSSHASLLRIGNVTQIIEILRRFVKIFFSTAKLVEVRCLKPSILCWMAIVQTYRSTD